MKTTIVDPNGDVRCPHCGAKNNFTVKRTGRAKIGLGLTVGVGALAAPKRLQCQGCGAYLRQGSSPKIRPLPGGATGVPPQPIESAAQDERVEVVLTSAGPRRIQVIKAVRDATGWDLRPTKNAVDMADDGGITLGRFSPEAAAALEAAISVAGGTAVVGPQEAPPEVEKLSENRNSQDLVESLERLAALRETGALSESEYEAAKRRLLEDSAGSS